MMSPLLGGHLHLARDSHIGDDEEVIPVAHLPPKCLELGDFIRSRSSHCLRRPVAASSLIWAAQAAPKAVFPSASSRSQSPGLRHVLRSTPGGPAGSPRGPASPRAGQNRSERLPRAVAATARHSQSPHFWQPWSAREVKSPLTGGLSSPRGPEAKASPGRGSTVATVLRGRSPRSPTTTGHSPKSSPSPDTSRSPSAGRKSPPTAAATATASRRLAAPRRSRGQGSPLRVASPFNPQTDYDIHLDLPSGTWHRFETRVGVADESKWPSNVRAKFQLIDEDEKTLLWESSETIELWAPTELCSVLMTSTERSSSPRCTKHLCLRVRCSCPPEGAVWIEPVLTTRSDRSAGSGGVSVSGVLAPSRRWSAVPWEELMAGEMLMELISRLSCRDVARLLCTARSAPAQVQAAWHCAFAHGFRQAYLRYFLGPLRKPPVAAMGGAAGIQRLGGFPPQNVTFAPLHRELLPSPRRGAQPVAPVPRSPVLRPATPQATAPPPRVVQRSQARGNVQPAACCQSCRRAEQQLPQWAAEVFDWRQICRRFYLAQLPYANVNFQLFNCSTPNGFVKDSGEILHVPRAYHGQSPNFRCGWNIPLGAVHFQSQPSAVVVAHRSPLGVAGVPPSVATVRGTAGPEPLAMTPAVSEKDSAVILPMALPGQLKLQWTLEVDPGRYLVVVTVGDRHVGFAAHLEVAGLPIFSGEWVEAGAFKSRCLICETRYGAITLGQHTSRAWSAGLHKEDDRHLASRLTTASDGLLETLAPPAAGSSAASDPPGAAGPGAAGPGGAARATVSTDALAKGTRLVSIRTAAVSLAREVEKERKASFTEFNGKISEARLRVDALRQSLEANATAAAGVGNAAASNGPAERELHRAVAKLAELQAQKALKLFCLIASSRRVTHPYVYLSGEAAANP